MTKEELLAQHPDLTYLSAGDVAAAEAHLRCRKLIGSGETVVQLAKAGEGNMNCTLRARMAGRSLVLKQSRPWVEKYPEIAAPWDRVSSEARFYELTGSSRSVAKQMPRLVDFDPASRILVLEDLGEASDFTNMEIMRRLIGVAQLPLDADMGRKKTLLERSRQMVLMPADHAPPEVSRVS